MPNTQIIKHPDEIELERIAASVPELVMLDGRNPARFWEVRGCVTRKLYGRFGTTTQARAWADGYNTAVSKYRV